MSRCCCSTYFVWLFEVLEIELRALQMLAEHPTAECILAPRRAIQRHDDQTVDL